MMSPDYTAGDRQLAYLKESILALLPERDSGASCNLLGVRWRAPIATARAAAPRDFTTCS